MKRTSLFASLALTLALSTIAVAAGPVPMVDVSVNPDTAAHTRTEVPRDFAERVQKAYVAALNEEIESSGKVDVIAAGRRATVVITDYYDPSDMQTKADNSHQDVLHRLNPGVPAGNSFERTGRPERAYVEGYIEFDGKHLSFKEESMNDAASFLATNVGRESFRRIRAL